MPKPVLQAMVLADHVYQDRTTGKFIIAGTFSTIWRQNAPQPSETEPAKAEPANAEQGDVSTAVDPSNPAAAQRRDLRSEASGLGGNSLDSDSPRESAPPPTRHTMTGPVTQMGSPYLYLALADVHGRVPLLLRLINLADASIMLEAQFEVGAVDPVAVAEFVMPMPLLPAAKPGVFSLDLLYQEEILGSWRINVREVPPHEPIQSPQFE